MRTTTSDRPSARFAATVLGVLTCVAAISGCSTTSTPGQSTTAPPPTTVPSATGTTGAQPITPTQPVTPTQEPTVVPQPPVTVPPVIPSTSEPPAHPPSGTTFAGEGLTAQQAADLQRSVDSGHQPWRLDRVQVAKSFAQARFGWTTVQAATGAPMIVFVTNSDGSKIALHLIQPATQGDAGIWEVDSGTWS